MQFEINGKWDPRGIGERAESRNPQIPGLWLRESSERLPNYAVKLLIERSRCIIGTMNSTIVVSDAEIRALFPYQFKVHIRRNDRDIK